jgi:16S rRNA (cytosine1402-N4)-methyltransferase
MSDGHEPVLLNEVMEWLAPHAGGQYCDATVGLGGHAREILRRSAPDGRLVGLDRDRDAIAAAGATLAEFGDRVTLVHTPFSQVQEVLTRVGAVPVDGFLVDLGVSSPQLDRPERGFSFRDSGPLDMRMDQSQGETAGELLRRLDETELETIIRDYGEERYARRIARAIVEARDRGELDSTGALGTIVARAMPRHEWHKNPATRTFQALRIAVNQELAQIERLLDQMADCLRPGGRLCVIAFHSLEDRIVKRRLRELAGRGGTGAPARVRLLNKHVIVAGDEERERNPRARSAKLRAAERI